MLAGGAPQKIPFRWARDAPPGDILPVSLTSLVGVIDGRASLPTGFVDLNFKPVSAGGVPPFGGDHNGILQWLSLIAQWTQAGGAMPFDAAFAASIGGYPKGARVLSARGGFAGVVWQSLIDNNSTNPDTAALGNTWVALGPNMVEINANTTLTAQHHGAEIICMNALVLTLPPPGTMAGLTFDIFNNNTGAIVTLQANGGVIFGYGTGTGTVNLNTAGCHYKVVTDGGNWLLSAFATFASDNSLNTRGNANVGGSLNVSGGAFVNQNLAVNGNVSTPATVQGGAVNSTGNINAAGSVNGAYISSTGNINATGDIGAADVYAGNLVQGNYGRMNVGAFGTGDGARVVTLGDFQAAPGPNGVWVRLPSGIIIQTGYNSATNANFQFPEAFPAACFAFVCGNADQQGSWVDNAFGYALDRANYYVGTKESNQPTPGQISNFSVSWIAMGE
jgi:hypothetical protein